MKQYSPAHTQPPRANVLEAAYMAFTVCVYCVWFCLSVDKILTPLFSEMCVLI